MGIAISTSNCARDLLALGNAIVDVVAPVDHGFLTRHDLHPGSMRLIDAQTATTLYAAMPPGTESSGGSAANTAAIAAMLGARVGFCGKVAEDQLGSVFRHDIEAAGVRFASSPSLSGEPTASCLVLVTPDAQRTMNTHLGAAVELSAADIDEEDVASSAVLYLEGYLFDPDAAKHAFLTAAQIARRNARLVAVSLSDPFCVERHRDDFHVLLRDADILFANEAELCSLYQTNTLNEALAFVRQAVPLAVVTRGAEGSVILDGESEVSISAAPAQVIDTTGAGDAYAGGFIAAFARNAPLAECGALGARAAAAAIAQYGARPPKTVLDLLQG